VHLVAPGLPGALNGAASSDCRSLDHHQGVVGILILVLVEAEASAREERLSAVGDLLDQGRPRLSARAHETRGPDRPDRAAIRLGGTYDSDLEADQLPKVMSSLS